jgi:hypothetical protein
MRNFRVAPMRGGGLGFEYGFHVYDPLESPDGSISIFHCHLITNDSSSIMYFIDGLVDIYETVHRLNPKLLGG